MKNYWFLLLGIGFLLAGFSRAAAVGLPDSVFIVSDSGEDLSEVLDESLSPTSLEEPLENATALKDSVHVSLANLLAERTVANKEIQLPADNGRKSGVDDPFIENSFVAVSQDPKKQAETGFATNFVPDRIVIPSIELDAKIIPARARKVNVEGKVFDQWLAPDLKAAGWQTSSAPLGESGNTVINGHHNEFGEVFKHLIDLESGDLIYVFSEGKKFEYVVANRLVLPERKVSLETRLMNARWIQRSEDERLTLVTCWPYVNNTHRLILVAVPYK